MGSSPGIGHVMYLAYLGESGNTGNSLDDANQPHHVHIGLLVHESQSTSMNGEFDAIYRSYFKCAPGEQGRPKGIRAGHIFQGVGVFASWPLSKRHRLIQDCFDILIRRQTPVIVVYIQKLEFARALANNDKLETTWQNPSGYVISRFLATLNLFMDELNLAGLPSEQLMTAEFQIKDFALVVASNNMSVEPRFMTQFLRSDEGIDSSTLLENICFVKQEDSAGSQLAHMCAYFSRRWLQNPSGTHPYFDALRDSNVVQVIYPVRV